MTSVEQSSAIGDAIWAQIELSDDVTMMIEEDEAKAWCDNDVAVNENVDIQEAEVVGLLRDVDDLMDEVFRDPACNIAGT